MGFCTADEYHRFLHQCPIFERMLVEDGHPAAQVLVLRRRRRTGGTVPVPLGGPDAPMEALADGSRVHHQVGGLPRAKDQMMVHTDIPEAPWYVVESDDKRRARINMIAHLVSTLDYHETVECRLALPKRPHADGLRPPAARHADVRARPRQDAHRLTCRRRTVTVGWRHGRSRRHRTDRTVPARRGHRRGPGRVRPPAAPRALDHAVGALRGRLEVGRPAQPDDGQLGDAGQLRPQAGGGVGGEDRRHPRADRRPAGCSRSASSIARTGPSSAASRSPPSWTPERGRSTASRSGRR